MEVVAIYMHDGNFQPVRKDQDLVRRRCKVGDTYVLSIAERDNAPFRGWYFATLHELFSNLPETMEGRWPDVESMRKWALVQTHWVEESFFTGKTNAEARRHAAWIDKRGDFVITSVEGCVCREQRPKSQSSENMPRADFKKSAEDVVSYLSELLGATRRDMDRAHPQPQELRSADTGPNQPDGRTETPGTTRLAVRPSALPIGSSGAKPTPLGYAMAVALLPPSPQVLTAQFHDGTAVYTDVDRVEVEVLIKDAERIAMVRDKDKAPIGCPMGVLLKDKRVFYCEVRPNVHA